MSEEYSDSGKPVLANVEAFPVGSTFVHNQKTWFAWPMSGIPVPLTEFKGAYRILLRSGYEHGRVGMKYPTKNWDWMKHTESTISDGNIVGYWYEAEEIREQKTENALKIIECHGRTWFVTDRKIPRELPDLRSGEWEYITPGLTSGPATATLKLRSEGVAWGRIYAYRSLIGDGPKKTFTDRDDIEWTNWDKASGKMPKAVAGLEAGDFEVLLRNGGTLGNRTADRLNWDLDTSIVAYRIINKAPDVKRVKPKDAADTDALAKLLAKQKADALELDTKLANQDMIARDGEPETPEAKHDRLVKELVGDGNIFPVPKVEVHPLFRVAPIPKTGMLTLWGSDF